MPTYYGERTFDWKSNHDPASRRYNVAQALPWPSRLPRSRMWEPPDFVLDQGQEGACVGFGWSAEAGASPVRVKGVSNDFARGIYNLAKTKDEWPGEDYEGTSVLAGAKAMQAMGLLAEYGYRWAFDPDDMRNAVLGLGDAVIGVPYKDGMFDPRPSGLVEVTGNVAGGHCMCVTGYHPSMRLPRENWFKRFAVYRVRQSWGEGFGRRGDIYIREEDMADLTSKANQGEVCIPLRRLYGSGAEPQMLRPRAV